LAVLQPELLGAQIGGEPLDNLDDLDPLSFPQLLAVIVIDDFLAYDRLLIDPLIATACSSTPARATAGD